MDDRNAPPPKPKRTIVPSEMDDGYSDHEYSSPIRRNRNMAARANESPATTPAYVPVQRNVKASLIEMEPETTIGVAVKMKGELSFERLLRIEGEFDGKLISKGSLVIGSKGCLIGNVESMKEVFVAGGKIIGNVSVERVILRDKACIFGNITAKSIKVDADCVVIGTLNINPHAPQLMNEKGEPVNDKS